MAWQTAAQQKVLEEQLLVMQALDKQLFAIQTSPAEYKVSMRKLSEAVEKDLARLLAELKATGSRTHGPQQNCTFGVDCVTRIPLFDGPR